MKRIDTLNEKVRRTYDFTIDIAETLGTAGFFVSVLDCDAKIVRLVNLIIVMLK